MPRPKPKIIEINGLKFRMHRILGFASFAAIAELGRVCGEGVAMIIAGGEQALPKIKGANRINALTSLMVTSSIKRGTMTTESITLLVSTFVLGRVDVRVGDDWTPIETTDDLDKVLDGDEDWNVWATVLYQQIPHCLGPTIAGTGTGEDSPELQT